MAKTQTKSVFLYDMALLMTISIMIIAAVHVFQLFYTDACFTATQQVYHKLYYNADQCILLNIAYPLLVFVSGYFFAYLFDMGVCRQFLPFLWETTRKYLISYIVFTLIMMLCTNTFGIMNLVSGGYWHLWLMPALFWCTMVTFVFLQFIPRNIWVDLVILIALFVLQVLNFDLPHIAGIQLITKWMCWFYLGSMICAHKDDIVKFMDKTKLVIAMIIGYAAILFIKLTPYGEVTWYNTLASFLIVVSLWYLVDKVKWKNIVGMKFIVTLSQYSFGIYIFSNWMQGYMITPAARNILPMAQWAADHVFLFPFLLFLITYLISWLITFILYKIKVGKFLIG